MLKNKPELTINQEVYNHLSDEQSRDIYLKRLEYLNSGNQQCFLSINERYSPKLAKTPEAIVLDYIKSLPKDKMVILYGAGMYGTKYAKLWKQQMGERLIGFCDMSLEKQNTEVYGIKIFSKQILSDYPKALVIITLRDAECVKNDLILQGISKERIYEMPCGVLESEDQYFDEEIMHWNMDGEVFIDAGCFDLKTSLLFRSRIRIKKVYALEPDQQNFEKCIKRKNETDFKEVELIQCGAWSRNEILSFSSTGKIDASIIRSRSEAGFQITARAIDDIVGNDDVTFIKMDIEGAELEALRGSCKTIKKCRPKLAISIYHKPEDMYEIPLYILGIDPTYKLYLRHYSNTDAETVLYAV